LKEHAVGFGVPVLPFDGIAEVWVDSVEEWKEIVSDPEFLEKIVREYFVINVESPNILTAQQLMRGTSFSLLSMS
jgi:hypothetical protein